MPEVSSVSSQEAHKEPYLFLIRSYLILYNFKFVSEVVSLP